MTALADTSPAADTRTADADRPEAWLPAFAALTCTALGYASVFAWFSGCSLAWDCATSGQFDPDRLALLTAPFGG